MVVQINSVKGRIPLHLCVAKRQLSIAVVHRSAKHRSGGRYRQVQHDYNSTQLLPSPWSTHFTIGTLLAHVLLFVGRVCGLQCAIACEALYSNASLVRAHCPVASFIMPARSGQRGCGSRRLHFLFIYPRILERRRGVRCWLYTAVAAPRLCCAREKSIHRRCRGSTRG